jgi:hypothetical protein
MYALYSKYKTNTQKKLFFSPFFPLDNHKKRKNMEKISPNRKKIIETQGARTKRVTFFMKNNLQKKEKQTIIVSGKEFRKRRLS